MHPSAVVSGSARIAASANIGPLAVIEDDAQIGERVSIGPGCIVQQRRAGRRRLGSGVAGQFIPGVTLGQRCILHAGAVVGADGFGFAPERRDLGKGAAGGQRADRR